MRDGGRIAAAIEVLGDVERTRRPVQDALKDWGLTHRFAGSKDRSAIGNLVFDVLRRRASLAAIMGSDSPRALALAAAVRLWGRGVGSLETLFAEDKFAPPSLTEDERSALSSGTVPADAPDWVKGDYPEWLAASLARAFGDRVVEEGEALAGRADVDLRVNTLKSEREQVLAGLTHLKAEPCRWSPVGIRIPAVDGDLRPGHVSSDLAYKRGWFEVQDEGSQLAALIAAAGGGRQVVDLCAGAGGKTLALSAALGNHGQIYAYDSDKRRFGDILDRIDRSGSRNIQIREPRRDQDVLGDLAGKSDLVLVDAPCTGSGTWRRRPDAKWRLAPGALDIRLKEQAAVLDNAVRLVRAGGRIVYITCSVLPEENEAQIAAFLARTPDFSLGDAAAAFATVTGRDAPDLTRLRLEDGEGSMLRLTPALTGTDGFFVAILNRAA
ncbi:Ribosomal RNA small subunit methyltransferase B [Pleomorphomonas sp. T1.2MG-36]|uniref:RsmB/NOP family class I SAM-dependent RNA methyltransferase n=1 Tax=Pleomorphomonas sp. T1.2MG-36 TaxID=3041167 RepID=UPI002477930C|nr:RsmB/NOP family class I SAM-dependent RNA methyltransferase [Pleomorphomonas sp. T1.2MG-36]CAI9400862.1 Ribosomal RNA small subunit methyltransferase B [Pleomorphomonas sp. T1.2MG-36]